MFDSKGHQLTLIGHESSMFDKVKFMNFQRLSPKTVLSDLLQQVNSLEQMTREIGVMKPGQRQNSLEMTPNQVRVQMRVK